MKRALLFLTFFAVLTFNYSNAQTVYDLQLQGAGYLGGAGEDEGNAVEIQNDNTIVIAGKIDDVNQNYGKTPVQLEGGGKGVLIRLNATGTQIKSISRIGGISGNIDDMAINYTNDKIAVVGSWGIALLSADGSQVLWKKSGGDIGVIAAVPGYSSGRRIAVGTDGTVAAMFNKQLDGENKAIVFVYDEAGNDIGTNPIVVHGGTYSQRHEDVAVDAENKHIITTGWRQAASNLQSPWVHAYGYNKSDTAKFQKKIYESFIFWGSASTAVNLRADCRGIRAVIGRDKNLYFTGYVHGGDNRFTRMANDYNVVQTNNVNIDNFTTHSGGIVSGFSGAYIAKMNPADGSVIKGQFHHNRNNEGKCTSWMAHSISANETGEVIFGGQGVYAFACRPEIAVKYKTDCNNQSLKINGTEIGPYAGNEGGVVELKPDFKSRNLLAIFTAPTTNATAEHDASNIKAVAAKGSMRVALATTKGKLFTKDPLQAQVTGGWKTTSDIYFATWTSSNPTGINSVTDAANIHVYPNPANDQINIQFEELNTGTQMRIMDVLGNIVLESTINYPDFTVNTRTLSNGIYFISIIDQDLKKTFKIVVSH